MLASLSDLLSFISFLFPPVVSFATHVLPCSSGNVNSRSSAAVYSHFFVLVFALKWPVYLLASYSFDSSLKENSAPSPTDFTEVNTLANASVQSSYLFLTAL